MNGNDQHQAGCRETDDIAIVGMACLFPGADGPAQFWHNIVGGVDSVTDPPADWQPELFFDPAGQRDDRVYTARGGYLGPQCRFEPTQYGVMPNSVEGSEPDQFVALQCTCEALADAGVPDIPINRERTGVIFGRGTFVNRGYLTLLYHGFIIDQVLEVIRRIDPDRSEQQLAALKAELRGNIPPLNAATVPGLCHSVLVGRIANRLDLHGPTFTVDGACASSLLAVEAGMRELRAGHCDTVLAGGTQVSTPAVIDLLFCHLGALSRTGRIAPFAADADGTLLGQGCGVVVLKRLGDAVRDGNRIYAKLKAIGVASDGRAGGLLAPQQAGQQLALERAYERTDVPKGSVELIEAHGTGIPLGDVTEMESLRGCFGPRVKGRPSIALGSVKSMVSHLIPAAGIAALIKTALALYQRVLPPTLHAEEPNPKLELGTSPFYLCTAPRPWLRARCDPPRRAGVNAFGFGGINAHAIVEEHQVADETTLRSFERRWPVELVLLSAPDRTELAHRAAELAAWTERAEGIELLDVAAACARHVQPCRLALCATGLEDLCGKLRHAAKLLAQPQRHKIQDRAGIFWYETPLAAEGRLAFLFPGEGAQYVGMLEDLCRHFPQVRRQFELTDQAFATQGVSPLPSRLVFPAPEETAQAESELFGMEAAAEVVATADRALLALLTALGIQADAAVGHSSGEFSAVLAAGAVQLSEDGLVQAIADGAACTRRIVESGRVPAAVLTTVGGASLQDVEQIVAESEGRLCIALDNCPHQLVIAGDEAATAAAVDKLTRAGGLCQRLPWKRAYHTAAFTPAADVLEDYCASLPIRTPTVQLWSCAAAGPYPEDPAEIRRLFVRQWCCKVRFRETVTAMHAAGVRLFVEVGPRGNLASFINDTLTGVPHVAIPLNVPTKSGVAQLCQALGMLAAHGVSMNLQGLYERRSPKALDLSAAPPPAARQAPRLRLELPELKLAPEAAAQLGRTCLVESAPQRGGPTTAMGDPAAVPAAGVDAVPAETDDPDPTRKAEEARALAEFQRTMRSFLDTQRGVMLGYARRRAGGTDARGTEPGAEVTRDPAADEGLPLVESLALHEPGQRVITECELDVRKHRFLRDHAFAQTLSVSDPDLHGLVVMPLAMSIELLAEAASILRPELKVAAVRDVKLLRWLAFDTPTKRVRVEARAVGESEVQATLYEVCGEEQSRAIASGTIEMAAARPTLSGHVIADDAKSPSRWQAGTVYTSGLFHGPAYQSVVSVDARDDGAVRATLQQPNPEAMFGDERGRNLVLPVALLDGAGQVMGLWGGEPDLAMGFPTGVERLEFSDTEMGSAPGRAVGRVRVQGDRWLSDVEVCRADGDVVLRTLGRTDQVADLPPHIWRYRTAPRSVVFCRQLGARFDGIPGLAHCTICELDGFDTSFLATADGVWALLLSRYILNRAEREVFDGLGLPPPARSAWLLGRVAAKDAVRTHLALEVGMADVGISDDTQGRPTAAAPGGRQLPISLSHAGGHAVAVAADPDVFDGVGIDMEPIRAIDPHVVADAFGPDERRLIENGPPVAGSDEDARYVSAWTAKEAVGKALGCGLAGAPRHFEIVAIDAARGCMSVRLAHAATKKTLRPAGAADGPVRADAYCRAVDGRIVALCLLELAAGQTPTLRLAAEASERRQTTSPCNVEA